MALIGENTSTRKTLVQLPVCLHRNPQERYN